MKSTVVDESLSSMNLQFCSRENQLVHVTILREKPLRSSSNPPQVCGWHMGHPTTSSQTSISGSYQQYRSSNQVYSRRYSRKWGHPHPWYLNHTAVRQFPFCLCTTSPHILTSTCSGTAIIIYLPSTASLVHLPTGLKQFALDQSFSRGNYNTLGRLWLSADTPTGSSIGYTVSFKQQPWWF